MPQPPDTTAYFYLGLAVTALILLVMVGSIVIRYRNLQRDAAMIAELERES